jgi:hypothetical protein
MRHADVKKSRTGKNACPTYQLEADQSWRYSRCKSFAGQDLSGIIASLFSHLLVCDWSNPTL